MDAISFPLLTGTIMLIRILPYFLRWNFTLGQLRLMTMTGTSYLLGGLFAFLLRMAGGERVRMGLFVSFSMPHALVSSPRNLSGAAAHHMHCPTVDSRAKDMDGNACGRLGRNLFVVMWVAGFLSLDISLSSNY